MPNDTERFGIDEAKSLISTLDGWEVAELDSNEFAFVAVPSMQAIGVVVSFVVGVAGLAAERKEKELIETMIGKLNEISHKLDIVIRGLAELRVELKQHVTQQFLLQRMTKLEAWLLTYQRYAPAIARRDRSVMNSIVPNLEVQISAASMDLLSAGGAAFPLATTSLAAEYFLLTAAGRSDEVIRTALDQHRQFGQRAIDSIDAAIATWNKKQRNLKARIDKETFSGEKHLESWSYDSGRYSYSGQVWGRFGGNPNKTYWFDVFGKNERSYREPGNRYILAINDPFIDEAYTLSTTNSESLAGPKEDAWNRARNKARGMTNHWDRLALNWRTSKSNQVLIRESRPAAVAYRDLAATLRANHTDDS